MQVRKADGTLEALMFTYNDKLQSFPGGWTAEDVVGRIFVWRDGILVDERCTGRWDDERDCLQHPGPTCPACDAKTGEGEA